MAVKMDMQINKLNSLIANLLDVTRSSPGIYRLKWGNST